MSDDKDTGATGDRKEPKEERAEGAQTTTSSDDEEASRPAGMSLEAAWHAAGDESSAEAEAEASAAAEPEEGDEVDPELINLTSRKRRRHPVISVLVIALAGYLMVFNASELGYYFASNTPQDLGEIDEALETPGKLKSNTYVSLRGAPDRKHALLIQGRITGYDSFFRLRGGGNRVFVQRHRTKRTTGKVISAVHTGRLVRFDSLPYHESVREYYKKNTSVAHDFDFATLRGKKAGDVVKDKSGLEYTLSNEAVFWVNATYPNEWVVQFLKQVYPDRASAEELRALTTSYAADDERSTMYWRFVVVTSGEEARKLMARFGASKKNTGFLRRQVSYSARFDQLRFDADALVITVKDETFPPRFVAEGEGDAGKIVARRLTPTRIPKAAVLYITAASKFQIPDDALVLLAGEVPKDKWLYLLLYLLLTAFVSFNAFALFNRARGR